MSRFIINFGNISIQDGSVVYADTLENFALDYGIVAPTLPPGAVCQLYEPGVRHAYSDGSSVVAGGDMPWSFGDDVLSAIAELVATRAIRVGAEPPPPPLDYSPGSYPPRLAAMALSVMVDSGDIPSMTGVYNIGAAIYLDVGQYMLLYINPLASTDYFPIIQDGAHEFAIVDQQAEYLIVQASSGGSPIDVPKFSVQIFQF